jgi:hypothetical protein
MNKKELYKSIIDDYNRGKKTLQNTELNRKNHPLVDPTRMQTGMYSYFGVIFYYEFFVQNDLVKAKNALFNTARSMQINAHFSRGGAGSQILDSIMHLYAPLISDCKPIIKDIPNWRSFFHEDNIKRGATYYVIQKLLSGDHKSAINIWENGKSHLMKKRPFFMIERECVHKMILKDKKGLVDCLYSMIKIGEDVYKKSRDKEPYLIDVRALSYIKLAYHLDIDISIEHELIPQDLVPFQPLENYHLLYDFMKRDDLPDFN